MLESAYAKDESSEYVALNYIMNRWRAGKLMDHEVLRELFQMRNAELGVLATYVFAVSTGVPFFQNERNQEAIDSLAEIGDSDLELTSRFKALVNQWFVKI